MNKIIFSKEDIDNLEQCIETVFIEKSVTFNGVKDQRVFSVTEKTGYSMSIPHGMTLEKTEKFIDNRIQFRLTKKMDKLFS